MSPWLNPKTLIILSILAKVVETVIAYYVLRFLHRVYRVFVHGHISVLFRSASLRDDLPGPRF